MHGLVLTYIAPMFVTDAIEEVNTPEVCSFDDDTSSLDDALRFNPDTARFIVDKLTVARNCGFKSVTEFDIALQAKSRNEAIEHTNSWIALLKAKSSDLEVLALPKMQVLNKRLDAQLECNRDANKGVHMEVASIKCPEIRCFIVNELSEMVLPFQTPDHFLKDTLPSLICAEDLCLTNLSIENDHRLDEFATASEMRRLTKEARDKHIDEPDLHVIGLIINEDLSEMGTAFQGRIRGATPCSFSVSILPRRIRNTIEGKCLLCYIPSCPSKLKGTDDQQRCVDTNL